MRPEQTPLIVVDHEGAMVGFGTRVLVETGRTSNGSPILVDISKVVTGLRWAGDVGKASIVQAEILVRRFRVEGAASEATMEAFRGALELAGYLVIPPRDDAADADIDPSGDDAFGL